VGGKSCRLFAMTSVFLYGLVSNQIMLFLNMMYYFMLPTGLLKEVMLGARY
jgi:hypothetical protein